MIKFKNINFNIGLINNEVKMKKLEKMKADNSQKENENYMQSLKSNEPLKKVLFKAKNISTTLMTNIVPQLATSIKSVVAEMMNNKNITKLKDWNTIKFLRQHCYDLADYDRKENINSAFEMAVSRGVKLGLMLNDFKDEFNIDKDNQVFVKSMVAVPFKVQKLEGVKGGTKKVKNTDVELVPVHTGIIDKVWNTKYPSNITPRQKGKAVNISKLLNDTLAILENLHKLAKSNPQKLIEKITDEDVGTIASIKFILDDDLIRNNFIKTMDNQSLSGKDKSKKIA
mgnify:CR=1 FL=1|tara:strand:+ start:122 stop:973 length:852 start_codon:yes stop_codon:yes gene_type:complete